MSQIDDIKNKLDVLSVVGSYVKLTKTGINYRGICPFHSEKGPSFFASPTRQLWKCFGCGKGGDIFAFIKEIEGVEFGDALKILAEKAGVKLKREDPRIRTERQRLYEICELSCSFFQKQLEAGEWGKKAKEYLLGRGITEESIKEWRVGYSPDTWQGLSDFLVGKGYNREEILKAGLAVKSEKNNNPYDRFRGRIVFPIFDLNGQVVGFGARVFKEADKKETAKYVNTPQTILYDKSGVLYGMHKAKLASRKKNQCVLTEGYTDAILCHQAGFENTVAASGTALTARQLSILRRYAENLILAFDMDVAGDSATKRGINLAEAQGFNIKIIDTYKGAKDPADIIAENPTDWQNLLDKARGIMDYYFDSAFSKFENTTASGKKEIARIILPAIKRLPSKIEQSHWISKLAQKLDVKEEAVLEELKNIKIESVAQLVEDNQVKESSNLESSSDSSKIRKKLLEEKILSILLKNFEYTKYIEDSFINLLSENFKNIINTIKKGDASQEAILANIQKDSNYKTALEEMVWKSEADFQEDAEKEIKLCLIQLKDLNIRGKRSELSAEIKKAEELGDAEKVNSLIEKFNITNQDEPR